MTKISKQTKKAESSANNKSNITNKFIKAFKSPIMMFLLLVIGFGILGFLLAKSNVITININHGAKTATSLQTSKTNQTQNLEESKDYARNTAENTNKDQNQSSANSTQTSPNTATQNKPSKIAPSTPLIPTTTPTKSSSQFFIPKDAITVSKNVLKSTTQNTYTTTYYAYYLGKAEELSKNYPKNTLVFEAYQTKKTGQDWHWDHIIIVVPRTSVKSAKLVDYDIYKVIVSNKDLSFESTEKRSASEYYVYRIYSDSINVIKTNYQIMGAGVYYLSFSTIGGKYFADFSYLKLPHTKRGPFGTTATYYVFPKYVAIKNHMKLGKSYVILSTGEMVQLARDKYMLTGHIEIR